MRFLSFILVCQICFLTADPVMNALNTSCAEANDPCTAYSCGESNEYPESDKESANDCSKGDMCNPFEACFCCCLNLPQMMENTNHLSPSFKPIPHPDNNTVLEFNADCFHPPEVT